MISEEHDSVNKETVSAVIYYQTIINQTEIELKQLAAKNNWFALLRLLTFGVFAGISVIVLKYADWYALIPFVVFLFVFRFILQLHDIVKERMKYLLLLKEINEFEIEGLQGNHSNFQTGAEYINPAHAYTSDLDIFGSSSIFQFLTRTTSTRGGNLLAAWLQSPAENSVIKARQDAVKELAPNVIWRQNFAVQGKLHKEKGKDLENFFQWLKSADELRISKVLILAIYCLPLISLIAAIYICFFYHPGILIGLILIQIIIVRSFSKTAEILHGQISHFSAIILSYSALIKCVEDEVFYSLELARLRAVVTKTNDTSTAASASLKSLSGLLKKFDLRNIPVFHLILNYLSFWDIKQMVRLHHWKKANQEFIPSWIETISAFEGLSSLATCSFNQPDWCMPSLGKEYFKLSMIDAGHPLIRFDKRVTNNLEISGPGQVILITGSNMSGKSTFLRTLGVNAVLSMAGSAVCAREFDFSNCQIFTSLRVMDSLSEGTSSFYAELKRLEILIKMSRDSKPVFFLLDEILRGTNSVDRYIGSEALIKQFIRNQTSGILASHDLGLADLQDFQPALQNYSFDVQVNGTELFFDYKLHPGKCTSLNASILMKKIGIDLED